MAKLDFIPEPSTPPAASGSVLSFGCEQLNIIATQYMRAWNSQSTVQNPPFPGIKVPRAGTLKRLRVYVGGTPGPLGTWTYTVMLNTVATLLTVAIAPAGTDGFVSSDVVVAEGDLLQLRVTQVGEGAQAPADVIAALNFE
jgi:hypothetical protein